MTQSQVQKPNAPRISRRATLIASGLAVVSASTAGARKIVQYAAAPVGERDCLAPIPPDSTQAVAGTDRVYDADLPWMQEGGFLNDASCLNKTPVYGVVQATTEEEIRQALNFARRRGIPVALAGVRHSMGGQAFHRDALVLDMTRFNQMSLDESTKVLTVQSGATWHDIQNYLHPHYAVKSMQSTDIFTVGGSISVNAHGMDHQAGAISNTIRSIRLMRTDGSVQTLNRTEPVLRANEHDAKESDLFHLVVGGYGLFGIILDVELEVTDNVIYAPARRMLDYADFPDYFENELASDPRLGSLYGHLSTAPQSLLRELMLYTYTEQTDLPPGSVGMPPLGDVSSVKLRRFVLNLSKRGPLPMRLKWFAEKHIEPRLESCSISRSQAMQEGEACLVSRNEPMHDSVPYLHHNLPGETDILHEYFLPRAQFVPFVDGLRRIVQEEKVNLLNASVRVVGREDNFLTYAPESAFSIVLYINQKTHAEGNEKMQRITSQLIDLSTSLGGRFFLPYQLHYTPEQLEQAYPEIRAFFAAKAQYDPEFLLTNTFYATYAPFLAPNV